MTFKAHSMLLANWQWHRWTDRIYCCTAIMCVSHTDSKI